MPDKPQEPLQMDKNADANEVIYEPLSEKWSRPPEWPCTTWMKNIQTDLTLIVPGLHEGRDAAQN